MRCHVPKKVLKDGWEPVKVEGDGNCLFRTISKVLTGDEYHHLKIKLSLVIHACTREEYYKKNILVRKILPQNIY